MPRREDQRSRAQNGVFEKGVGAPFARARQSAEAIASARAARHDRSSSLGTVGGESSRRRPANRPRNRDKRHEPLIEACKLNGVEPRPIPLCGRFAWTSRGLRMSVRHPSPGQGMAGSIPLPPFAQGVFERLGRVIGCGHVSGLFMRPVATTGRYGDSRTWRSSRRRA